MKAILMAGGFGTRLRPLTINLPKPMTPVGNLPIMEHVVSLLADHGIITRPKTMTKKQYLYIEDQLEKLGEAVGLPLSALDLYLWYMETGKVLK